MSRAPKQLMDRQAIRSLLQSRQRDLLEELERRTARIRVGASTATPGQEIDDGDAGDLDAQLLEITSRTLRRIDQAIRSIDTGRYGWCTRCRRRISDARLRAMPFAVRCRECESAREREAAHTPGPSGVPRGAKRHPWEDDGRDPGSEDASGSLLRFNR